MTVRSGTLLLNHKDCPPRDPLFSTEVPTLRDSTHYENSTTNWQASVQVGDSRGLSLSVGDSGGGLPLLWVTLRGAFPFTPHTSVMQKLCPCAFRGPQRTGVCRSQEVASTACLPCCSLVCGSTWHLTGNPFQAASPDSVPYGGHGSIHDRKVTQ